MIEKYKEILMQWNKRYKFLGRGLDVDKMIDLAKMMADFADIDQNSVVLDVGSGFGFPGLIWSGEYGAEVHFVERGKNRSEFIGYCLDALKLKGTVISDDYKLFSSSQKFDFITAQAVCSLKDLYLMNRKIWIDNPSMIGVFIKTQDVQKEIKDLENVLEEGMKLETELIKGDYGAMVKVALKQK